METLLVCLLAGYGVWLTVYLWWERRQREHPASQPDVTSLEREDDVPDIVGKSSFKMRATTPIAAKPTPQAATESKTESATEKAPTFAAGTDNRTSARIPDEELDEAFEHLEIPDIPLEYEEDDDEYIEAELPLAEGRRRYASGASFEEIDAAMKAARNPAADDASRRQAGRLFGQMEGTEFFDRLVSGSADVAEKITGLMDYYLSPPSPTVGDAGTVAVQAQNTADAPAADGFDIRDFV